MHKQHHEQMFPVSTTLGKTAVEKIETKIMKKLDITKAVGLDNISEWSLSK